MKRFSKFPALLIILSVTAQSCFATLVPITNSGFICITNNNSTNAIIGENQLYLDVIEGTGQALFTFKNSGPEECVISEIYFESTALLSFAFIIDKPPEVDFKEGATPSELPGNNLSSAAFETNLLLATEPENPQPYHGIGPGEELTIAFDLVGSADIQDAANQLHNGEFNIGIRVIAFAGGGSESFVNTPEPASFLLLSAGMYFIRKQKK